MPIYHSAHAVLWFRLAVLSILLTILIQAMSDSDLNEVSSASPMPSLGEPEKDLLAPIMQPQSELEYDIYDGTRSFFSPIAIRSPVREAQKGIDIVESGRTFRGFEGRENVAGDVLQYAGERLKADQAKAKEHVMMARKHEIDAYGDMDIAGHHIKTGPNAEWKQNAYERWQRSRKVGDLASQRGDTALQVVRQKGSDIKNIGLVNKDMRNRMLRVFQPIKNPMWREAKRAAGLKRGGGRPKKEQEGSTTPKERRSRLKKTYGNQKRGNRRSKKAADGITGHH